MSEPDFNLLAALDALLSEVSVAGAARRLGLSASAMSRTLLRLRNVTGDPLLVRAGRQMVLTPHAEAIRERSQLALREVQALLRPALTELQPETLQRTFTLRANDGFIEAFGAPLIAAVTAEAPGVRLSFAPKPEKTSRYLREGLVDLEIGVLGQMGPEIRVQSLFRDHFIAVVRTGHPLARLTEVGAEQYVAYGHVVVSRRGQSVGLVDEALEQIGLSRNVVAVVPSFPAALAVARASELVALVPASFLLHQHTGAAQGQPAALHTFALPVATQSITVSLMWHPRNDNDLAHRWLRQLIRKTCQQRVPG
ncbi:LysR family transcriptional regulator [Pokkaliibacter sp. MBI-7]|uniref:LysR family transcriptional regulator n=1 Tax=Pokkaliibacter sp. MBI-7 TaxID=3040600 RepID=UPI0024495827|nr:LysR family transcriptional regulator [Pokkaliibacter sp. MBI-7]MDH2434638.1 LysR family transcriptional regulator [Pokkaliibacter sp. MBI-7]